MPKTNHSHLNKPNPKTNHQVKRHLS